MRQIMLIGNMTLTGAVWGALSGAYAGAAVGCLALGLGILFGIPIGAFAGLQIGTIAGFMCGLIVIPFDLRSERTPSKYIVIICLLTTITPIILKLRSVSTQGSSGDQFVIALFVGLGIIISIVLSRKLIAACRRWEAKNDY